MHFLAQADQAAAVVTKAMGESGWMAGFLVLIVLAALALFGVLIRGDRSELREINRFVRTEMPDVIDGNTIITSRFISALHNRPCLRESGIDQFEVMDMRKLSDDEIAEFDGVARLAADRIKRRATQRIRNADDKGSDV